MASAQFNRRNQPNRAQDNRSSRDYEQAVDQVLDLVEVAMRFAAEKDARLLAILAAIKKVRPLIHDAVKLAPQVADVAKPVVNLARKGIQEAADKLPDAAAKGASEAAHTAKKAAEDARHKAQDAANAIAEPMRKAARERDRKKAQLAARKALLEGAIKAVSTAAFLETWGAQGKLEDGIISSLFDYTGCYVILFFDKKVKGEDYCRYQDVYVGTAERLGQGVHDELSGLGNADVYADVKFKRPSYVLLYPCESDKLEELRSSLIIALDADDSYNAPRE